MAGRQGAKEGDLCERPDDQRCSLNTGYLDHSFQNIIISRTDSIGDVMLTLPLAKVLRDHFPGIRIAFMGRDYTRAVIEACENVDEFIDVNDFLVRDILIDGRKPEAIVHVFPTVEIARRARELKIPLRIGTTNRLYHWWTCNKLVRLSRRHSPLHEAQLNLKLLSALGIRTDYSLEETAGFYGFTNIRPLPGRFEGYISPEKYNLILHPKSQGSAREWGLDNFITLIHSLDKTRFNILISGTAKERTLLDQVFEEAGDQIIDITGLMSLDEFISFISCCDGVVANSTGPLHIAAALEKDAFGIYPRIRPMHPGRWAPLGPNVRVFTLSGECNNCRANAAGCSCIRQISPADILSAIEDAAAIKPGSS